MNYTCSFKDSSSKHVYISPPLTLLVPEFAFTYILIPLIHIPSYCPSYSNISRMIVASTKYTFNPDQRYSCLLHGTFSVITPFLTPLEDSGVIEYSPVALRSPLKHPCPVTPLCKYFGVLILPFTHVRSFHLL